MVKVLITGATGNVGQEVIRCLAGFTDRLSIVAGVRNAHKVPAELSMLPHVTFVRFDFEDSATYAEAFQQTEILFLLRPPQLADIQKTFRPMLLAARHAGVAKIVFLSVQGADKSRWVPHHKIENLIRELSFEYIFLRPGYFIQNLTTTLYADIQLFRQIRLPAGNALFNWVDVQDIGAMAAGVIGRFDEYRNQAFDITGYENLSFGEVMDNINRATGAGISYKSVSLWSFWRQKRRQGTKPAMILVMMILHYLPRFTQGPAISTSVEHITGRKPATVSDFALRHRDLFVLP